MDVICYRIAVGFASVFCLVFVKSCKRIGEEIIKELQMAHKHWQELLVNFVSSSSKSDLLMVLNSWTLYFLFTGNTFSRINFWSWFKSLQHSTFQHSNIRRMRHTKNWEPIQHVVDDKVVTVTFTVFQDKICGRIMICLYCLFRVYSQSIQSSCKI